MKVVCIDNNSNIEGKYFALTIGKIYDVCDFLEHPLGVYRFSYRVDNHIGMKIWYDNKSLMDLSKFRELKLEQLGI
jgi:hypothetical protein